MSCLTFKTADLEAEKNRSVVRYFTEYFLESSYSKITKKLPRVRKVIMRATRFVN